VLCRREGEGGEREELAGAMKKKVDPRVRALIEACVATNHRSLFVIVGDKGRHQVGLCARCGGGVPRAGVAGEGER
jgi:hypothetical protein